MGFVLRNLLNRRSLSTSAAPSRVETSGIENDVPPLEHAAIAPDDADDAATQASETIASLRAVSIVTSQPGVRALQMADVAEVERLAESGALTQLRAFHSFDYSVVLHFHGEGLCYYVALYHDGSLWRVLTAIGLDAAETAFRHLQEQATRLSEGETRRAQLLAQNDNVARMIRESEAQAERLRNDLERDAVETQRVTRKQHQVRKELAQLEAQRVAGQARLNVSLRQVQHLSATNNDGIRHVQSRRDENIKK